MRNARVETSLVGFVVMAVLVAVPADAQDGGVVLKARIVDGMGLEDPIARYGQQDPAITAEAEPRPYDEHHAALLTALATGEVPDVVAIGPSYSSQFLAEAEDFVDLRTLGVEAIEGDYLGWRWAQGVADDGSIVGIPSDVGVMAMCYRTDLFDAAGLPTEPEAVADLWPDWASFVEVGRRYAEDRDAPFLDSAYDTIFDVIQHEGGDFHYSDKGDLIYATNPRVRAAFDTGLAAIEGGLSARTARSTPEWDAALAGGGFAVVGCSAEGMNVIERRALETEGMWGVTSIPGAKGASGGMQLAIPAASEHPAEAFALLASLVSPDSQLEVFERHGPFPSTPELYDTPPLQSFTNPFFSGAPIGRILAEAVEAGQPVAAGPQQRTIEREFESVLAAVEDGQVDPVEAWDVALADVAQAIQG